MKLSNLYCSIVLAILALSSCKKGAGEDTAQTPAAAYSFSYPDSILYIRESASDYVVLPSKAASGIYTAYPEGIEIDNKTGAINVSKSETGLRYRIYFTNDKGETFTTKVVISGINYTDKYYYLKNNDTIVPPVYNADPARSLPLNGSIFDEGSLAKSSGCALGTVNGQINIAASIRDGMFGNPAQYGATTEVETKYRLNDNSNKAQNGLKVKFYYYEKASDVPQYLLDLLQDRQNMFFRINNSVTLSEMSRVTAARPRPPCIIVIAR